MIVTPDASSKFYKISSWNNKFDMIYANLVILMINRNPEPHSDSSKVVFHLHNLLNSPFSLLEIWLFFQFFCSLCLKF